MTQRTFRTSDSEPHDEPTAEDRAISEHQGRCLTCDSAKPCAKLEALIRRLCSVQS